LNNLTAYSEFLTEDTSSPVSTFLKAQYNNIFKEPNQNLNNLFTTFIKKADVDKNIPNLYQRYARASQTTLQNEINNAETTDSVNKLVTDEIKYFYFSLKSVINKLQNDEFTMKSIFKESGDRALQYLMCGSDEKVDMMPEDQFANAVTNYINKPKNGSDPGGAIAQIKTKVGLDTQQTPQQPSTTSESIMFNIYKILEADDAVPATDPAADLVKYKKSAIEWVNKSLFDLLKPKIQLLSKLGATNSNSVDQLSKQMKSTNNDNAKKMIINKIMNMDKVELSALAKSLGFSEEEIGKI
jgi:hypothetical protein